MASAWKIWAKITELSTIVCQAAWPVEKAHTPMPNAIKPINTPSQTMYRANPRAKMLSLGLMGDRRIVSRSAGSTLMPRPSTPSVTRLIHRIWKGVRGSGRPISGATNDRHHLAQVGGQRDT